MLSEAIITGIILNGCQTWSLRKEHALKMLSIKAFRKIDGPWRNKREE
jgi:hypothetical protein